jgi:hypothetical protein
VKPSQGPKPRPGYPRKGAAQTTDLEPDQDPVDVDAERENKLLEIQLSWPCYGHLLGSPGMLVSEIQLSYRHLLGGPEMLVLEIQLSGHLLGGLEMFVILQHRRCMIFGVADLCYRSPEP